MIRVPSWKQQATARVRRTDGCATRRCVGCLSPIGGGTYCTTCAAWHDLAVALDGIATGDGLRSRELRRATATLRPRPEPLRSVVTRIEQRVAALEARGAR